MIELFSRGKRVYVKLTHGHNSFCHCFDWISPRHLHPFPSTAATYWVNDAHLCTCTLSDAEKKILLKKHKQHMLICFGCFIQVVGPSSLERTRGTTITLRSETSASSCSTADSTQTTASYSWSLVSSTQPLEQETFGEESRDPRVLVIPRHTLGFAGSSYVFQLAVDFGGVSNAANVTGE